MKVTRSAVTRRRRAFTATVRRAPAPALLLVSMLGWAAMVWLTASSAAHAGVAHGARAIDAAHAGHATDAATGVAGIASAPHGLAVWLAMVLAMAPLLLVREVSRLWHGSLRRRRRLTLAVFAGGYAVVWIVAGVIAVPMAEMLGGGVWPVVAAVALTVAWQCSPLRQQCLNVCHRNPRLRVFGGAAQADAWRYGVVTGAACAAACAPIMVLVLLATDVHLVAMGSAAVLLTFERYQPARRPRWRIPFTSARPEHIALGAATDRERNPHGDRDDAGRTVDAQAR